MSGTEVREYVEQACAACGVAELAAKIVVRWNSRFTARMGDAKWFPAKDRGVIRLSVPLWPKATPAERIETVIHETCHVIADYRFGPRQAHGPHWRALMRLCGYRNATRCHAVARDEIAARRRQTRMVYKLACGCPDGVALGRVQYRRLRAGVKYHCRTCRQGIRLN
jgi:SprT protein